MYNSNINEEASDIEQKQKIIFNTTQAIRSRVKDFHNILLDPPRVIQNSIMFPLSFYRL